MAVAALHSLLHLVNYVMLTKCRTVKTCPVCLLSVVQMLMKISWQMCRKCRRHHAILHPTPSAPTDMDSIHVCLLCSLATTFHIIHTRSTSECHRRLCPVIFSDLSITYVDTEYVLTSSLFCRECFLIMTTLAPNSGVYICLLLCDILLYIFIVKTWYVVHGSHISSFLVAEGTQVWLTATPLMLSYIRPVQFYQFDRKLLNRCCVTKYLVVVFCLYFDDTYVWVLQRQYELMKRCVTDRVFGTFIQYLFFFSGDTSSTRHGL